jgi:hypothetical protein
MKTTVKSPHECPPQALDTDTLTDVHHALCILDAQMNNGSFTPNSMIKKDYYAFLANAVMGQINLNRRY